MIPQDALLVLLVELIDRIPARPVGPAKRLCPLTHFVPVSLYGTTYGMFQCLWWIYSESTRYIQALGISLSLRVCYIGIVACFYRTSN
jgi:hypothetical protein